MRRAYAGLFAVLALVALLVPAPAAGWGGGPWSTTTTGVDSAGNVYPSSLHSSQMLSVYGYGSVFGQSGTTTQVIGGSGISLDFAGTSIYPNVAVALGSTTNPFGDVFELSHQWMTVTAPGGGAATTNTQTELVHHYVQVIRTTAASPTVVYQDPSAMVAGHTRAVEAQVLGSDTVTAAHGAVARILCSYASDGTEFAAAAIYNPNVLTFSCLLSAGEVAVSVTPPSADATDWQVFADVYDN